MNTVILNLTQHTATPEQREAGVYDPKTPEDIKAALTFNELPSKQEIETKALTLAALAVREVFHQVLADRPESEEMLDIESQMLGMRVMIGGAPYLMAPLEKALRDANLTPVYAFSKRESVEVILDNGDVRKTAVFKHLGFV